MAEKCIVADNKQCPTKKAKLGENLTEEMNEENTNSKENTNEKSPSKNDEGDVPEIELNLSAFEVTRILQNNCARKLICLEGKFENNENPAIVLLEQKSFPYDKLILKKSFFDEKTIFQKRLTNDIYRNYDCFPTGEHNSLQATVVYPATQNHIEKYKKRQFYIIDETYELYQQITLPYIETTSFSLEWITNILEHKAEQENIIYEDPDKNTGFVLVTDLKWDKQLDTLKLIALPFQKIKSLRELNGSHLPLLKNIRDAGIAAISKKFNLSASQLRIYFHYQPSYYYLHVHFCHLMFDASGIYVEKAHLLSTVIRNLELMSDYYTKAVLSYVVVEDSSLYEKFKSHGILMPQICEAE